MSKEELIEKLKSMKRYNYDGDDMVDAEDIEDLIKELGQPELFCKTIKEPYNSTLSTGNEETVTFTLTDTGDFSKQH
jgi:IS4 transposase